ncbi:MAG: hypothetical protein WKG07_17100 [Hymenobacter sp.]
MKTWGVANRAPPSFSSAVAILAGYLWLFPVGAGRYNVGLGMLSELIAEQQD